MGGFSCTQHAVRKKVSHKLFIQNFAVTLAFARVVRNPERDFRVLPGIPSRQLRRNLMHENLVVETF